MRSSFDIGEFLEEKEFDIIGKTFKGVVRISSLLHGNYAIVTAQTSSLCAAGPRRRS